MLNAVEPAAHIISKTLPRSYDAEIEAMAGWQPGVRGTECVRRTYTVQWSTDKTGDFLVTAFLEDCEVGGCAKACSVQV